MIRMIGKAVSLPAMEKEVPISSISMRCMISATKNIQKIQKTVDLRKNIDEHELSLYNKFIYAYNHFTRKGMVIL